jgi:hypothetical protein
MLRLCNFRPSALVLTLACCCGPVLAAPAPAAPAKAEPDRLTPADSDVVAVVNVRQLLAAPLVRKYALDTLTRILNRDDRMVKLLGRAGLDPLKDVDTLTVSMSGDLPNPRLVGLVRGRFDPDKVHAVAADFAKQNPEKLKVTKEGDLVVYHVLADKTTVYAAFADRFTLVVSPDRAQTLAVVGGAAKAAGRLNKQTQKVIDMVPAKDAVWVAAVVTDKMKEAAKGDPDAAELVAALGSATGGVEVDDGVKAALVLHTDGAESAGKWRKKIEEVLPLLNFLAPGKDAPGRLAKAAIGTIKVAADKSDVRITFQVTEEMIQKAAKKEAP